MTSGRVVDLAGIAAQLDPVRDRPEIEWSVALDRTSVAADRHVIYGLDAETVLRVLAARGHDGGPVFEELERRAGAPSQIAFGKDGDRTKVYWFRPAATDPYFVGADLRPRRPVAFKHYRLVAADRRDEALALVAPALRDELAWLLDQPAVAGGRLFHMVLLSRTTPLRYTAVHVGLAPDWERLLAADEGLLHRELVRTMLTRLGIGHRYPEVARAVLAPPMRWVCYLSLALRPDGFVGANVYARADPIVRTERGVAIVEPGVDGLLARPVRIDVRLRDEPAIEVRLRASGGEPAFARIGGWWVEYSAPGVDAEALGRRGWFDAMRATLEAAARAGSVSDPARVLQALRADSQVARASIGPDMRHRPGAPDRA